MDERATQGAGAEVGADSSGLPPHVSGRPARHPWVIPDTLAAGVCTVAEVISTSQGSRGFLVSIRSRDFQKIRGKVTTKYIQ